jgi:hypothetical protein
VKGKARKPRVLGYEILRRVKPCEVPGHPVDPRTERAVLGTWSATYLVPPGIDVFELGLIDSAGHFELLPITPEDKPLWDEVVELFVSDAQAERQRAILMRSYRALHAMIQEADELEASIAEWARYGIGAHPVFGMLRLAAIAVWKAKRRGRAPLTEREFEVLHTHVARRVAAKIRAHITRSG